MINIQKGLVKLHIDKPQDSFNKDFDILQELLEYCKNEDWVNFETKIKSNPQIFTLSVEARASGYKLLESIEKCNIVHIISFLGYTKALEIMLKQYPMHVMETSSYNDLNALVISIRTLNLDQVKLLVEGGAKLQSNNLNFAVKCSSYNIVEYLLNKNIAYDLNENDARTALHHAAYRGNAGIVELLLKHGMNINAQDSNGQTPLHLLCTHTPREEHSSPIYFNQAHTPHIKSLHETIDMLLKNGADINKYDKFGQTPLHLAVKGKFHQLVEYLLNKEEIKIDATDKEKKTPLHFAADYGDDKMVKLLVEHSADVNAIDFKSFTPLTYAVRKGSLFLVKFFIEKGARVDIKDKNGAPIIAYAAGLSKAPANISLESKNITEETYLPILKELLKQFKSTQDDEGIALTIAQQANFNMAAEIISIYSAFIQSIEAPQKKNAFIKPIGSEKGLQFFSDLALIHFTKYQKYTKAGIQSYIKYLQAHKNSIVIQQLEGLFNNKINLLNVLFLRVREQNKFKALCDEVSEYNLDEINELIKAGVSVNDTNEEGKTPLHYAIINSNAKAIQLVQFLLENDANLNIQDKDGRTPLHYAILKGRPEIANLLLEKELDLDIQDKDGRTPLHYAILEGQTDLSKILIEKGAGLTIKDLKQNTPLDLAPKSGNPYIIKSLKKFIKAYAKKLLNKDNSSQTKSGLDEVLSQNEQEALIKKYGEEFVEKFLRRKVAEFIELKDTIEFDKILESSKEFLQKLLETPLLINWLKLNPSILKDLEDNIDILIQEINLLKQNTSNPRIEDYLFIKQVEDGILTEDGLIEVDNHTLKYVLKIALNKGHNTCFLLILKSYKDQITNFAHEIFEAAISLERVNILQDLCATIDITNDSAAVYGLLERSLQKKDKSIFKLLAVDIGGQLLAEHIAALTLYAYTHVEENNNNNNSYNRAFAKEIFELLLNAHEKDNLGNILWSLERKAEGAKSFMKYFLKEYKEQYDVLAEAPLKQKSTPLTFKQKISEKAKQNNGAKPPSDDEKKPGFNNPPAPDKGSSEGENDKPAPNVPFIDDKFLPRKQAKSATQAQLKALDSFTTPAKIVPEFDKTTSPPQKETYFKISEEYQRSINIAKQLAINLDTLYKEALPLKGTENITKYAAAIRYNLLRLNESLCHFKDLPDATDYNTLISTKILDIKIACQIRDSVRHNLSLLENRNKLFNLCKALIAQDIVGKLSSLEDNVNIEQKPIILLQNAYGFYIEKHAYSDSEIVSYIKKELNNIKSFYAPFNKSSGIANELRDLKENGRVEIDAMKMSICAIGIYQKALSEEHPLKKVKSLDKFRILGNKIAHQLQEEDRNKDKDTIPIIKHPAQLNIQSIFMKAIQEYKLEAMNKEKLPKLDSKDMFPEIEISLLRNIAIDAELLLKTVERICSIKQTSSSQILELNIPAMEVTEATQATIMDEALKSEEMDAKLPGQDSGLYDS
ncbi:MAG: hypothetical protein K0R02_102 [Rickettsiaceae bacterium]|jgi:ankyrin repeat protein|nr:hypothetical protein [Rickettsiaceae bacterium]